MNYKKIILITIICIFALQNAYSQSDSVVFEPVSLWSYLLPGGTHFHNHKIGKGLLYSASEIGLLSYGLILNNKIGRENMAMNAPLIFSGQMYMLDKGEYILDVTKHIYKMRGLEYNYRSIKEYITAPFRPRIIIKPLVLGFMAFGVLNAFIPLPTKNKMLSDVKNVEGFGIPMNVHTGSGIYGATSGFVSFGAGTTEEIWLRGYIMPLIDLKKGKSKGLTRSSLLFSAFHIPNYIMTPTWWERAYYVTTVTSVAFILGKNVQNNNYNLSQAIAAHFWYDFALMLTSWIINPENNLFGFNVQFKI